jgi:hypothetical protein
MSRPLTAGSAGGSDGRRRGLRKPCCQPTLSAQAESWAAVVLKDFEKIPSLGWSLRTSAPRANALSSLNRWKGVGARPSSANWASRTSSCRAPLKPASGKSGSKGKPSRKQGELIRSRYPRTRNYGPLSPGKESGGVDTTPTLLRSSVRRRPVDTDSTSAPLIILK